MENGHVEVSYANERFAHEKTESVMSYRNQYGVPENYNPAEHPAVRLRNHSNADRSETQRKRRSKNRLSNRRSTGYVNAELVEEAFQMGPNGNGEGEDSK
ncbi:unnamed protein product [Psylliodes chrysocephalus]|uniref:Uncharacterized protein n=1 Tax=Psylliodes chrysocephalus TaxID=3402493 RepID=A0A9P0D7T9_9CUCU|nr:unnamed protein product [Psylliodes chrysocephala]